MPSFDHLAEMVDTATLTVEEATLRTILAWLRPIERDLQETARRAALAMKADATQTLAFRKARAEVLAAQIRTIAQQLTLVGDSDVPAAFMEMQRRSYEAGIDTGVRTLRAFDDELPAAQALTTFGPRVDLDRLASLAADSTRRLHLHTQEIVEQIQQVMADGLTRGTGVGRLTRDVRDRTKMLRYQAERIVRTEAMSTADDARRATFQRNDLQHVQRVATNDSRVCPFCAYRDGMVYRLADRPVAVLHPNDRCVLVPWKEDWPAAVRGDDEHAQRRREAIRRAQADDPDFTPNDGPTYWERQRNEQPPTPVWTPM